MDPQGGAEEKLGQIAKKKNKNCNGFIEGLNVCAVCKNSGPVYSRHGNPTERNREIPEWN